MTPKHCVLIAEEHSILRAGLCALLRAEPDLDVAADTDNGEDTLRLAEHLRPALVITDLRLQGDAGQGVIAAIHSRYPATRILVLTQHASESAIRDALRAGAHGYVLKHASNVELVAAVRSVLAGQVYLSPSILDKVVSGFLVGGNAGGTRPRRGELTEREREILTLIAAGRTSKFIADHLGLSIKTVEKHRSNLMKKLDLHNVSALTTFAIGQGLVGTV
jgi:DNA-binding NarL/FixJ family response regulator